MRIVICDSGWKMSNGLTRNAYHTIFLFMKKMLITLFYTTSWSKNKCMKIAKLEFFPLYEIV